MVGISDKTRTKSGHILRLAIYSAEEVQRTLMLTLCAVHGRNEMSLPIVCRWVRKLNAGVESVKYAPKSGRPKSACSTRIVEKLSKYTNLAQDIFSTDYGHGQNFKCICIVHSAEYFETEEEKR